MNKATIKLAERFIPLLVAARAETPTVLAGLLALEASEWFKEHAKEKLPHE